MSFSVGRVVGGGVRVVGAGVGGTVGGAERHSPKLTMSEVMLSSMRIGSPSRGSAIGVIGSSSVVSHESSLPCTSVKPISPQRNVMRISTSPNRMSMP